MEIKSHHRTNRLRHTNNPNTTAVFFRHHDYTSDFGGSWMTILKNSWMGNGRWGVIEAVNSRSSSLESSDNVFVVFWGFIHPGYQGF